MSDDGDAAISEYRHAFDASEHGRHTDDNGAIVAQLRVGGALFIVADEAPDYDQFSPQRLDGTSVRIALSVSDPDSVFERAIAVGAAEVFPVADVCHERGGDVLR